MDNSAQELSYAELFTEGISYNFCIGYIFLKNVFIYWHPKSICKLKVLPVSEVIYQFSLLVQIKIHQ